MEETCVRKYSAVTAGTASVVGRGVVGRDVIGRNRGLGFKPHVKAILLSCSVSVFGSIAAFAAAPDPSHDNAAAMARWAGLAVSKTVDECFAWDIACLLERPVGAVPGGPSAGPGDRGREGDDGGGDDGGDDGGSDDGGSDDGGSDDGGSDDGGSDDGGGDDGGGDNKGLGNGDENDDSSDNGRGNTDADNPGKGRGGNGGNGRGGSER